MLAMSNMKPGDTTNGDVVIQNTGTLTGAFKLTKVAVSDTGLAQYLDVKVEECTTTGSCAAVNPTPIYNGTLDLMTELRARQLGCQRLAPLQVHRDAPVRGAERRPG